MTLKFKLSSYCSRISILLFFAFIFFLGLNIYKDYGISWDENISHVFGMLSLKYILGQGHDLIFYSYKYLGSVFFETFLVVLERIFNLSTYPRELFFMRHLMTFFVFYLGLIFFYKLCVYFFKNWKIALLGCIFLVVSPRIFADSFYNSKDIPSLAIFIISIYTLVNFLNKKTTRSALWHALISAALIDIRISGIIIPFL